jgi:hypothetical protein
MNDDPDLDAWEPQAPPRDFAVRVMAAALDDRRASRRKRGGRVAAGLVLVCTTAAAMTLAFHLRNANARGDVTAQVRREVRIGSRALAVLERGAHVTWDGETVSQSGGDVFWRVEPGARFAVHTPAADVAVKGTCFRITLAAGSAGVGVYEGHVSVSRDGSTVDLGAGESVLADARGLQKGELATLEATASDDDAWMAANESLAEQVSTYRRRVDALGAEKHTLEDKLAATQARLAEQPDAAFPKDEYDLSPDDWRELAKKQEVRYKVPGNCTFTRDQIAAAGLPPDDVDAINRAHAQSVARLYDNLIKPLCVKTLGNAAVVERVGFSTCMSAVLEGNTTGEKEYGEVIREAAEMRAGLRPLPAADATLNPALEELLGLTDELHAFERDLTQMVGPDEAKRIAYFDKCSLVYGVAAPGDK